MKKARTGTPPAAKNTRDFTKLGKKRAVEPTKAVEGETSAPRMDRPAFKHGGRVSSKKGTTVNVVIGGAGAGAGGPPPAVAVPVPHPVPVPAGGPPGAMPPGAMPPGAMPPRPMVGPPGAGPMPVGPPTMKRGGRIMAGAGTGLGRLNKSRHQG